MAAKKSFAAYMNPFSTGSVSQWTEKAVPAECILFTVNKAIGGRPVEPWDR